MIRLIKYFAFFSTIFIILYFALYFLTFLPRFDKSVASYVIENAGINQASGLAASLKNPGILWTHNDKTWGKELFAVGTKGQNYGKIYLDNEFIIDSEDIAVGPGPVAGEQYIYLADIGDNDGRRDIKSVIRIAEPQLAARPVALKDTVRQFDMIDFVYADGRRDAETLMIDPLTRDLFIISKRDANARVYCLPFPQKVGKLNVAEFLLELPMTLVVAGDISADGGGILLKTYGSVYYWQRIAGESIDAAFARMPEKLQYYPEPQGESICWAQDQPGYFTTSEELLKIPARLVYYKKSPHDNSDKVTQLSTVKMRSE